MSLKYTETGLPGVLLIKPDVFKDSRGLLWKPFIKRNMRY